MRPELNRTCQRVCSFIVLFCVHLVSFEPFCFFVFVCIDKQFLITRNVACHRRCKQMEYVGEETMVEDDGPDGEEGWVETHHFDSSNLTELEDNVCEMTLDSAKVYTYIYI